MLIILFSFNYIFNCAVRNAFVTEVHKLLMDNINLKKLVYYFGDLPKPWKPLYIIRKYNLVNTVVV